MPLKVGDDKRKVVDGVQMTLTTLCKMGWGTLHAPPSGGNGARNFYLRTHPSHHSNLLSKGPPIESRMSCCCCLKVFPPMKFLLFPCHETWCKMMYVNAT